MPYSILHSHNQSAIICVHTGYPGSVDDYDLLELGNLLNRLLKKALNKMVEDMLKVTKNLVLTVLGYLKHIFHHLV